MWANVIGLVLASLAVGYWVGGKIADRSPSPRVLGRIVVVRGGADRDHPVRGRAFPGRLRRGARPGLRRRGDRVVLRRARALRACADAARDGRAVRDPARDRRRARRGLGRRAPLRAVDRRQPARHLPGRARPHPDDRNEEDPARGGAARRALGRRAARPALAPGRSGSRRADRDPGRRRARGAGADLRARVALPVHPRHRAERRPTAVPERGSRRALALAAATRFSPAASGTRTWRSLRSSGARCGASRSSATRAARRPARWASSIRRHESTVSSSTRT